MKYGLEFRDVFAAWETFLGGVAVTLSLSIVAMIGGLLIGIICAAGQIYGRPALRRASAIYVEVVRNTPLLVQLFLVFFGLPSIGIKLDSFTAAIIALVINLGAYSTEIVRAGFEAVPHTQVEAGSSLGLSGFQVFRHVVLFPALKEMVPALASQFVFFMLATAAVSQIAVPDLFHVGAVIQSRTFRDFEVYLVVALLYLTLAILLRFIFAMTYRALFGART